MPHVDSDGVKIHYTVEGEGFPVMLHTGGGGDGTMWKQAGYVKGLDGYRCILVDHRGHGRSDRPPGLKNHLIEHYVEDVLAVLNVLEIEKAAFWGYSAGTWVGYALAAAHPQRVAGLIASGAIGSRDFCDPEERADAERTAALSRQYGLGYLIKSVEESEGIAFDEWFWQQMTSTHPEMYALEVLGAAEWRGPWSVLSQIRCPVLMLVGELEDPHGHNQRAASMVSNARCVTFPGLGHVGAYLNCTLALSHALLFLQAIST